MNNVFICLCNYTLVVVPTKYDSDIRLPKNDIRHRRALKYIKKHKFQNEVLTIDVSTINAYRDPNDDQIVRDRARRSGIKVDESKLYIRDVELVKQLSKPTQQAL